MCYMEFLLSFQILATTIPYLLQILSPYNLSPSLKITHVYLIERLLLFANVAQNYVYIKKISKALFMYHTMMS